MSFYELKGMILLESYEIFKTVISLSVICVLIVGNSVDLIFSIQKIVQHRKKNHHAIALVILRIFPIIFACHPFFEWFSKIPIFIICIFPIVIRLLIKIKIRRISIPLLPLQPLRKQKGKVYLGRIKSSLFSRKFYLPDCDLKRHIFITGLTGMGKSNLVKILLQQLCQNYPSVPFLLVEFKGEYQNISTILHDVIVYRPGETLKLNIFNPMGEDPKLHAEKLLNMLASCQILTFQEEFSSQMEKIFMDILYSVCADNNRRNWDGFDYYTEMYKNGNQNKFYNLNQTICSIENRIRRLKTGPLRSIFEEDTTLHPSNLVEKNVIIDLSSIIHKGGTKNDAIFFSNVLFNQIWLNNLKHGLSSEIKHFTLIEDSQFLLSQKTSNKLTSTSYLEDFALLLRGTGECLVTINTRPTISEDVMANAGVLISFQLNYDKNIMGKLLGLSEKKCHYLTQLDIGECVIKTNSIPTPFVISVPLNKLEKKSMFHSNQKILFIR